MPIQVLDAHTAELIAAGEVVERPASVVKELVENAVDAKAKHVEVEIEQGGVRLIRIQDDGCGIAYAELPVAFLRHATSKVCTEKDLEAIATLGFRGEALASIAAVSKVEVLTRAQGQEDAGLYQIEGGEEKQHTEAARPFGTTFSVRDLFFNTPARMKFLKKDTSEAAYVTDLVGRLALSHPEISLRYCKDGKELFCTPGYGDLKATAYAVLGKEFTKGLVESDYHKAPYRVNGFISLPSAGRKSRSMQYFYINGRYVKSRTLMAALEQAYRGRLMQGRFPACLLFVTMPPELLDVNVHPAKTEVRFANDAEVFSAVYAAVKEALSQGDLQQTELVFAQPEPAKSVIASAEKINPVGTALSLQSKNRPAVDAGSEANTLNSSAQAIPYRMEKAPKQAFFLPRQTPQYGLDIHVGEEDLNSREKELPQPEHPVEEPLQPQQQTMAEHAVQDEKVGTKLQYVGQLFSTYVLAQWEDTLYVIDKHAAHERLLYEKFERERKHAGAQMLLCPVAVPLGGAEKAVLLENEALLYESGVELEEFGGGDLLVRAVPAEVNHEDIEGLLLDVAKGLLYGGKQVQDQKIEWVLHSMACRAAIKGGDNTPPEQLMYLATQILQGDMPPFCPHGRPVLLKITRKELEKQFGRLG